MSGKVKTAAVLQALAQMLDETLEPNGFVLLTIVPEANAAAEGSRVNYVSNRDRSDVVAALKEITGRFEGQSRTKGTA